MNKITVTTRTKQKSKALFLYFSFILIYLSLVIQSKVSVGLKDVRIHQIELSHLIGSVERQRSQFISIRRLKLECVKTKQKKINIPAISYPHFPYALSLSLSSSLSLDVTLNATPMDYIMYLKSSILTSVVDLNFIACVILKHA